MKKSIFFLCSPHIGTIDSWLPVLWDLKKEVGVEYSFICVVTKTSWINESALKNILVILADKIFDKIIIQSPYKDWITVKSFAEVYDIMNSVKGSSLFANVVNKMKGRPSTRVIGVAGIKLRHFLNKLTLRRRIVDWDQIFKESQCLIYDIGQDLKLDNKFFLDNLRSVPKFSLFHGLITQPDDVETASTDKHITENVTAYLYSKKEINHYKDKFGLKDNQLKVVGVPRHSPAWIQKVIESQPDSQGENYGDYIFIISRPYDTSKLPRGRMKSTLYEIKKIAFEELHVNVVIKLHPSERNHDVYEEVFGEENKGGKWFYSSSHSFLLGKNSLFAIAFCSGISVDLVSMGVPVIEKLDLRGIPEYENIDDMKDENGDPVLRYRYYNLLLGASSNEQLRSHVQDILSNRDEVIKKLKHNYEKIYPIYGSSQDKITSEIISILK